MRRNDPKYLAFLAQQAEDQRRSILLTHLGWVSPYRPGRGCEHRVAREIENDEPIEHPVPLPEHWFPLRIRYWTCATCGTAVNIHAFKPEHTIPLPKEITAAWWQAWRDYECKTNRPEAYYEMIDRRAIQP